MTISAATCWRIRAGGNDANGGGYDSTISGAGTDYTDQDSPQLSLTDLATSGAGSTTLTSATGGFTAAMVGNCFRISAGTNFQTGYYFITAYTDTNTVTVDRTPTSGGAGSGGTGKLGGAFLTMHVNFAASGGGYSAAAITSPLGQGHTIYIRGSGGENPGSADYTFSNYLTIASGGTTGGRVKLIGYNGRPRIDVNCLWLYQPSLWWIENIHIKSTGTNFAGFGPIGGSAIAYYDVWLDQAGYDINGLAGTIHAEKCKVFNTGSTSAGTATYGGISVSSYGAAILNNDINGWRGSGVYCGGLCPAVENNVIRNCKSDGVYATDTGGTTFGLTIRNNTIYGNSGDGVEVPSANSVMCAVIEDNVIVSNGGYGKKYSSGTQALNDRIVRGRSRRNFYYNNTSGNETGISAGSADVTLTGDPFTNAAGGDFSLNNTSGAGAAVRAAGGVTFPGGVGTSYADGGAMQHQDAGGGGGVSGWVVGG